MNPKVNLKEEKKKESRRKILEAAAHQFRTQGYIGSGIDDLMKQAGLTAGAFYAHFESKNHLLEEALKYSVRQSYGRLLKGLESFSGPAKVRKFFRQYLHPLHRDTPEIGCVIPAMGSEITRQTGDVKKIVEKYLQRMVQDCSQTAGVDRKQSLQWMTMAIGAIMVSRLVDSKEFSDEILAAAKDLFKDEDSNTEKST